MSGPAGPTSWRMGSRCTEPASLPTAPSSVAENISTWRSGFTCSRMRRTAGMKPMSARRSASSMTTWRTSSRRRAPIDNRSSSRPGQATTIEAPASSALRCGSVTDTAVHRHDVVAADLGQRTQLAGDLLGELTGRCQHERRRTPAATALEIGHDRDAEGEGLARAGRGATGDVTPGEGIGDDGGLDRERVDDPGRGRVARTDRRARQARRKRRQTCENFLRVGQRRRPELGTTARRRGIAELGRLPPRSVDQALPPTRLLFCPERAVARKLSASGVEDRGMIAMRRNAKSSRSDGSASPYWPS